MAESAEANFFQHLLPAASSQQMQDPTNKRFKMEDGQRGKGKRRGRERSATGSERKEAQQLLEATAKLALRLADARQILLQDCGFTWFVGTGQGGVLPIVFGVSAEWKRLKEQTPHLLKKPLRVLMMECILNELTTTQEGDPGRDSQKHGDPGGLDDRSGPVEVQGLGPSQEGLGADRRCAAEHAGPGQHPESYECRPSGARSSSQIPSIAAYESGHGDNRRAQRSLLHHPGGTERRQGGTTSSMPDQAWRQHGPQTAAQPLATRASPETRPGETCFRPAPATVMHLVLRNSGNLCYMNTLVHAILWLMANSNIQVQDMGHGYNAWRAILAQHKACNLMQMLPWTCIVQGWRHGGALHDIRDFFEHVLQRCQVSPFHGAWEARFQDHNMCRVQDRGLCESIITMDVPITGPWRLQDVVNEWGDPAFPHGLLSAPQWLAVRLNRFHYEDGRLQKVRSEMEHEFQGPIDIPIFRDQLQRSMEPYMICAFAVHLGNNIQHGHYRALLVDHASGKLHYCDDDKRSRVLRTFGSVAMYVYVLFLIRRDIMQCAMPVR